MAANGDIRGGGDVKQKRELEKIYQKKSQLEHILLRPDSYIGSVQELYEQQWVFNKESEHMEMKEISYIPGLYKIFDEILVNAADNKQRDGNMNEIRITINKEEKYVSIYNNGEGIPVEVHKEEKMYIPSMIFGHLLTSSNYDDTEIKVTGGRNGFGAKLCNIFSKEFTVETACNGKLFKQTWRNNMSQAGEIIVKDHKGKDYTKITFYPDLVRFKLEELTEGHVDIWTRRAFDVAASTSCNVKLNDVKLNINSFKKYVELFMGVDEDNSVQPYVYNSCDRWEVAVACSNGQFQQVSFVNSIATTKGGRHVDYVLEGILKYLLSLGTKKHRTIAKIQIKNYIWIFINCLIENPSFDSQTKENMTLLPKSFGSNYEPPDNFLKSIAKLGILENAVKEAQMKDKQKLYKQTSGKKSRRVHVEKLSDANEAGGPKSMKCTLILTEGDSAKTFAMAGMGSLGRDFYGVFPLKGKLLNVRDIPPKQLRENVEITNLLTITGLKYQNKYVDKSEILSLRYGKVMIMTDQDQDGSHIKGLLINFIHHHWPALLKIQFLEEFITPIVKATKGDNEKCFFSLPEFDMWKKETRNWHKFKIKYYKGLGTSTPDEAKSYFEDLDRHRIKFSYSGQSDDNNIIMAFGKKHAEKRKEWLAQWMESVNQRREMGLPDDYLYEKNTKSVTFSDFVNRELVLFSNSDNERSIPSAIDGLKPGQRKVIFTCFKRNDKVEVKVSQLAGSVAEVSAYHHGETSLIGTIVNLAQNYVGSNNINLLQPIGMFGSRLQCGKDSASGRYINTMLSPLARYIFHPQDDPILDYQRDDNKKIEPVYYVPIIPMVLVNGAEGIGTGWSTKILNHNPRDIITNLHRMLNDEETKPMIPWYKKFRGEILPLGNNRYTCFGVISKLSDDTIEITELPIGVGTEMYKTTVLEAMLPDDQETKSKKPKDSAVSKKTKDSAASKNKKTSAKEMKVASAKQKATVAMEKAGKKIMSFSDYCTDKTIRYVVKMAPEQMEKAEKEGWHKFFKLQTLMNNNVMVGFDSKCILRKFETTESILKEFFELRMNYYIKRKEYLTKCFAAEALQMKNKARFIQEKCDGILTIENKKRNDMFKELHNRGYDPDPVAEWKKSLGNDEALIQEGEEEQVEEELEKGDEVSEAVASKQFGYLLQMQLWSLTLERKNKLLNECENKIKECEILKNTSEKDMWRKDLDELLQKLDVVEAKEDSSKDKIKVKDPKKKKEKINIADTFPSRDGIPVAPKLDTNSIKRVETHDKVKRIKKEVIEADADEYDHLGDEPIKSLTDRIGDSPQQIEKKLQANRKNQKQPKSGSPKKTSPKKKKNKYDSSEESYDISEEEDHEMPSSIAERKSKRAAGQKINYVIKDESSEASGEECDSSRGLKEDEDVSGSGGDVFELNNSAGSEETFNTLLSTQNTSENTKPPQKDAKSKDPVQSKAITKRAKSKVDSDEYTGNKPKRGRNDDGDSDSEPTQMRTTGRKRKPVPKYASSSDSDYS